MFIQIRLANLTLKTWMFPNGDSGLRRWTLAHAGPNKLHGGAAEISASDFNLGTQAHMFLQSDGLTDQDKKLYKMMSLLTWYITKSWPNLYELLHTHCQQDFESCAAANIMRWRELYVESNCVIVLPLPSTCYSPACPKQVENWVHLGDSLCKTRGLCYKLKIMIFSSKPPQKMRLHDT